MIRRVAAATAPDTATTEPFELLRQEAGPAWADAIARAALKAFRKLRNQDGGGGEGAIHISVSRQRIVDVRHSVEEKELRDGRLLT